MSFYTRARYAKAYLGAGEVMVSSDCGRVLIEYRLPVAHSIIRQMGEVEIAWLLWLTLLLEV